MSTTAIPLDDGRQPLQTSYYLQSCQRHGKDPFAYLKDVLTRLPAMTNQDDLAALTPARWSPS